MLLITIARTRRTFIVTIVSLVALVGVAATVMFYPGTFSSFTCRQFDIPEYEKQYGFTLGELPARRPDGTVRMVVGVSAVDPQGAFARSGIRSGDIPRMHHGFQDFCGDIAWAEESDRVWIEVSNVYDERAGKEPTREVLLRLRK